MKYTSRGLRRRGDTDKWEVILTHKDPMTGEPLTTYHTVTAKTKRVAERARDELIVQLELQGGAMGTNMTVQEYMDAYLLYKQYSGTVEPSTIKGYRSDTKYITKYIGDVRLSDLKIPVVNKWMADATKDGYAPKTITKSFRLLKQALKYAQSQDLLTKNPCDFCKPPKRVKTPINALTRDERNRMLRLAREAQPQPLAIAIELALTTGMRRGEVCALRWSDLNDEGTITVRRALAHADGGYYVKEPKTGSSIRTIPLTPYMRNLLGAMRDDTKHMFERLSANFKQADPYILGTQTTDSRPYNPDRFDKDFGTFCKMNGFDCTFHDLRHTFATMAIGNGIDVRTVASYLGHANVSMTLDIYADVDPEAKMSAVDKIEACFDGYNGSRTMPAVNPFDGDFAVAVENIPFSKEQLEFMLKALEQNMRMPLEERGHNVGAGFRF